MHEVFVHMPTPDRSYPVKFPRTPQELKACIDTLVGESRMLVVSDTIIAEKTKALDMFDREDVFVIPAGEEHKRWPTVESILNRAFEKQLTRQSVFIAVGGGVVGDMTGFAASVYLRGVRVVQVPTTLLAMVDASIGGKTGIDCAYGKNLIGAIHQPIAVLCARFLLETLPDSEICNGFAEMVKHGIINSPEHFAHLEQWAAGGKSREELFELIPESLEVKRNIVEQDERETGLRMHLNLGHTFGHALELLSGFEMPHGVAVAKGIAMACDEAVRRGMCSEEDSDRIKNVLKNGGLDLTCPYPEEDVWNAMQYDKKRTKNEIKLVLPEKIGRTATISVPIDNHDHRSIGSPDS